MTTRPEFYRGSKVYGLLAVALFVVLTAVFVSAQFGPAVGFPEVESITAAIGFAMFDITTDAVPEGTESFLAAFIIIALVLDAALDGAIMLARRDDTSNLPLTDGGRDERRDD